jgi:hypothetical protein
MFYFQQTMGTKIVRLEIVLIIFRKAAHSRYDVLSKMFLDKRQEVTKMPLFFNSNL